MDPVGNTRIEGFATIDEAAKYCGISANTLENFTTSGHAPHYEFDGKGPFYKKSEIRAWVRENLVSPRGGMPIPRTLDVLIPSSISPQRMPPFSLSAMHSLCHVAITGTCSGVYFLCDQNEVVYVGQSQMVVSRIATHIAEGVKKFDVDRVYFLPCPIHELNSIERHFIEALRPKYNFDVFGNLVLPSRRSRGGQGETEIELGPAIPGNSATCKSQE